jgi:hypothetical protein
MPDIEQLFDSTNALHWVTLFLVGWAGVSYLLSKFGGWSRLAEYYRFESDFAGERWKHQSASMRLGVNYNNVLTIGVSSTGVLLEVLFLFRVGHPPLFIPWSDIRKDGDASKPFGQWLVISRAPTVPLKIRNTLIERIEAERHQEIQRAT